MGTFLLAKTADQQPEHIWNKETDHTYRRIRHQMMTSQEYGTHPKKKAVICRVYCQMEQTKVPADKN